MSVRVNLIELNWRYTKYMIEREWRIINLRPLIYGYGFISKHGDGSESISAIVADIKRQDNGKWFWQSVDGFGGLEPSGETAMNTTEAHLQKHNTPLIEKITAAYRYKSLSVPNDADLK